MIEICAVRVTVFWEASLADLDAVSRQQCSTTATLNDVADNLEQSAEI